MTTFLEVKNRAVSTLAATISAAATSLSVASGEGALFPSSFPYHITLEDEIIAVGARTTDTMSSLTRAQQGTSAAIHNIGVNVRLNITAKHLSDLDTWLTAHEACSVVSLSRYIPSPLAANFTPAGTLTLIANKLYAMPYPIIRPRTPDLLVIYVETADAVDSNLRLGIYNDTGNGFPGTRLTNGGVVDVSTTGLKTVAYTTQLTRGLYWIAFIADGTPEIYSYTQILSIMGHASNVQSRGHYHYGGTYGNLPDPFPAYEAAGNGIAAVGFRFTSND